MSDPDDIFRNAEVIDDVVILPTDPPVLRAMLLGDDLDSIRELVANGAEVDAKDAVGRTPLHHACESGHFGLINLFVSLGAQVNAVNNDGYTPLDRVVKANRDICAYLRDHGAKLNAEL